MCPYICFKATTSIHLNTMNYDVQNHAPAPGYFASNVQLTYPDYDNYDLDIMSTGKIMNTSLFIKNK